MLAVTFARLAMTVTVGATYAWPLDAPVAPTSTFGEYRSRHFHGGLDLSTQETIGLPVRAPAGGQAVRVRTSGSGYGRALYLYMEDGRTAVFGHLDGFAPAVQAWVDSVQRASGAYEQDLAAPAGRFRFARGDTVAWSGGSGAGPPHLHVELREGDTGINPWRFGLQVPDSVPPTLSALWVYPAGPDGRVEGEARARRYSFRQTKDGPKLDRGIVVRGPIGAAVEAWDRTQARSNQLGVYEVSADLDGERVYEARFDSVSWLAPVEADVVFDPRARSLGHTTAYSLTPPAGLKCLALVRAETAWRMRPGAHALDLAAEDADGNRAQAHVFLVWSDSAGPPAPRRGGRGLEIDLLRDALVARPADGARVETRPALPEPLAPPGTANERVFGIDSSFLGPVDLVTHVGRDSSVRHLVVADAEPGWSQTLRSADGEFALRFDNGSAFGRQAVTLEVWGGGSAKLYQVEPDWMAIGGAVEVRLRVPPGWPAKRTGIFRLSGRDWSFVGGVDSAESGVLSGRSRNLGTFTALRDTIGPRIGEARVFAPRRPQAPGARKQPAEVRWSVADQGSGLDASGVRLVVDAQVEAAEYDGESGRLAWRPRVAGFHVYQLTVTDRLGNASRREGRFRVP